MAQIIYDLADLGELTQYVRAYNDEQLRNRFVLDQVLPNVQAPGIEADVRAGSLTMANAATFRAWDTQPGMAKRPGAERKRLELPPVSQQIPLTEEESLRLDAMERGSNDPLVRQIYDDVERMVTSVQARIEIARGQVLSTGVMTINENGINLSVDYGVPGSHKPVIAAGPLQWTVANAATAKPITDLLAWTELYQTDTGTLPRGMLMSRARLAALAVNDEVRSFVQGGAATAPPRVNLATLNSALADEGIPPLLSLGADPTGMNGPFFDEVVRVDDVATKVIPEDKVVFVPSDPAFGSTFYGLTAEATRLVERGLITRQEAPGLVAVVLQNDNPVQTFTLATAIALPVIVNPELAFVADVA